MGWVTSGAFSFFEGRGVGLGYCRVEELYALQVDAVGQPKALADLVLYRNRASTCLRLAGIRVIPGGPATVK